MITFLIIFSIFTNFDISAAITNSNKLKKKNQTQDEKLKSKASFRNSIKKNEKLSKNNFILEKINIFGNKRFSQSDIIVIANINIGDLINVEKIDNIMQNLYATENFDDIDIIESPESRTIDIKINERPIINEVIFIGNEKFSEKDAIKYFFSKPGKVYSKQNIKYDLDILYSLYQKGGYFEILINPKVSHLDDGKVDLIFEISEGIPTKISDITFIGNKIMRDFEIKNLMTSKEPFLLNKLFKQGGSIYQEDVLYADVEKIKTYYFDLGYLDFNIKFNVLFDEYLKNVKLQFFIEENQTYKIKSIKFEGNNLIIPKDLIADINNLFINQINKTYNHSKILDIQDNIKNILSSNGFPFIDVAIDYNKNLESQEVDILFSVNESQRIYINEIEISGNRKTKDYVIRRELEMKEGDIYDISKINKSKDKLYMLGYFKIVEIRDKKINKNSVNLEIVVEEQFAGNANFSFGFSTYEGLIGMLNLGIQNFMGHGKSVNFGITRSSFQESYSLGFYETRFLNSNLGLGMDVFFSRFGNVGSIFGSSPILSIINYQSMSACINIRSGFYIMNRLYYSFGIGYSYFQMSELNSLSFQLYKELFGERNTFSFTHSIIYDKTNKPRFATSGYSLKYSETYAGFGGILGNQNFIKRQAGFAIYIPLFSENIIISFMIDGSFVQNTGSGILGIENLSSLGYYNLRGFSFFGAGPRIQLTNSDGSVSYMGYAIQSKYYFSGTLDIASPLFLPKEYGIKFSTFVDFGSLWGSPITGMTSTNSSGGVESVADGFLLRVAIGAGIAWQSPMGEIRFDFAQPIVKAPYDIPMTFIVRFGNFGRMF